MPPISRSSGVGYFEYEATVDDILKSLVVYDDGGTAGEITLPGREPLMQTFVDLPFDRTALDSAPALLNALRGAEVRVTGAKPMNGRLLRVVDETSRGPDNFAIPRNRVTDPARPAHRWVRKNHARLSSQVNRICQRSVNEHWNPKPALRGLPTEAQLTMLSLGWRWVNLSRQAARTAARR